MRATAGACRGRGPCVGVPQSRAGRGDPVSNIVSAQGLVKDFRSVRALDGVDIEVARGQRFGIVGESGSGKSTLARCLLGLDRPDAGTVRIDGKALEKDLRSVRKTMQMVFQDPMSSLDPRMRVRDIVAEP